MSTSTWSGTPYCSAYDTAWAKASAKPEMVEPSLAITRNISPGTPSSKSPTVMYPSCPAMSNLWVMAWRSSGRRRRDGTAPAAATASAAAAAADSAAGPVRVVFNGCVRLLPSR